MTTIAVSTTTGPDGEYAAAIAGAGAVPTLLRFDPATVAHQLTGVGGLVISGGGDVDPERYGPPNELADDVDPLRDAFEIALIRYARERRMPTLCICRGLQIANVAFGGTLIADIATRRGAHVGALHRVEVDGRSERGLVAGHTVTIAPDSALAAIVGRPAVVTGSRHHQSLDAVAPELGVGGTTPDGIVEAAEARFASPFWLGVQWHPESTIGLDDGASAAIFHHFVAAAAHYERARHRTGDATHA